MPKIIDLTGERFGRLTVISLSGRANNGAKIWKCICDCGKEHFATTGNLLSGSTKSCGCYHKEMISEMNYKHGLSKHRLHGIWRGMEQRCCNPKSKSFEHYGGRGITICKEWVSDFENFYNWAIANGYDEFKSIDRIDVNGNYEPSNCRWVNSEIQANNKRNNNKITFQGETHTITEWSRILHIDRKTISDRIFKLGWSPERALKVGVRKNNECGGNKT